MAHVVNAFGLVALWIALAGEVTIRTIVGGFLATGVVLAFSRVDVLGRPHKATLPGLVGFVFLYVWQLVVANLRLARMVLTPRNEIRSGVFLIPSEAETDLELFLLANLNTFTPGSVVLDGVEEGTFHVHLAGPGDLEPTSTAVKDNERRVLWFIR